MVLTPLPVPAVQPPPTPEAPDAVAPTPHAAPKESGGEGVTSVVVHLAAITEAERDLRARRDAVAARLQVAGFEMEYGTLQTTAYRKGDLLVLLPMDDRGISLFNFERMVESAERVAPEIDRTNPNMRRWKGPALDDVGDVAALFVEMALDLEPPRPTTLRVGMHGEKGFCFFRVEGEQLANRVAAAVCEHFPAVGDVHTASIAVVERGILDRATGPGTDGASDGEDVEPDPLPPIWQTLDPGIATAVELLRDEGLATTDSGDGYSKKEAIEAGEALDYAHVFIQVPDGERADDIIANATAIPWANYGYRTPKARLLESVAGEPEIVALEWPAGWLSATKPGPMPTAPGPTLAEVQEQLTSERKRADEAEAQLKAIAALLDADPERSPAYDGNDQPIPLPRRVEIALMPDGFGKSEIERRITEALDQCSAPKPVGSLPVSVVGRVMATAKSRRDLLAANRRYRDEEAAVECALADLGAGLAGSILDRLMQVLPVEDRRALLELEAAEHRFELARLKACRLNPPTPGKLAEYAEKLAKVEAQIAALPDSQTPAAPAWSLEAGLWLLEIAGVWLAEYKPGDYLLISGTGRFPASYNDPQDVLRRRGLPLLPAEALDHSPDVGNMVDG